MHRDWWVFEHSQFNASLSFITLWICMSSYYKKGKSTIRMLSRACSSYFDFDFLQYRADWRYFSQISSNQMISITSSCYLKYGSEILKLLVFQLIIRGSINTFKKRLKLFAFIVYFQFLLFKWECLTIKYCCWYQLVQIGVLNRFDQPCYS